LSSESFGFGSFGFGFGKIFLPVLVLVLVLVEKSVLRQHYKIPLGDQRIFVIFPNFPLGK
jgi:hypothetical protein